MNFVGSSNNNYNHNTMQKFKGVVPQQNGHWGAQIYANHQRIWLGTFKTEKEAAMAYDSATIKLRSGESHRNFPWNDRTVQEPLFQSPYTTEAVLSMIRDGTYPSKFASFLISNQTLTLTLTLNNGEESGITRVTNNINPNNTYGDTKFSCTQLFQKELTPSDVGKLNRLVIPKKHASRYFPCVAGVTDEGDNTNNNYYYNYHNNNMDVNSDTELMFYDKLMRSWKFRYCYWRSSQSFVFTRGWNRFVKDKNLRAKDVIVFYKCEPTNNDNRENNGNEVFCLIDVIYNEDNNNVDGERKGDFKQGYGKMLSFDMNYEAEEEEGDDDDHDDSEIKNRKEMLHSSAHDAQKGLRLFGVTIN